MRLMSKMEFCACSPAPPDSQQRPMPRGPELVDWSMGPGPLSSQCTSLHAYQRRKHPTRNRQLMDRHDEGCQSRGLQWENDVWRSATSAREQRWWYSKHYREVVEYQSLGMGWGLSLTISPELRRRGAIGPEILRVQGARPGGHGAHCGADSTITPGWALQAW